MNVWAVSKKTKAVRCHHSLPAITCGFFLALVHPAGSGRLGAVWPALRLGLTPGAFIRMRRLLHTCDAAQVFEGCMVGQGTAKHKTRTTRGRTWRRKLAMACIRLARFQHFG
jgi:hypothetical protein